MPYYPSPAARKIIALVNNAKDLAINHQKRTVAADVIEACRVFAKGQNFGISDDIFDILSYSIKNKQTQTLMEDFDIAEESIVAFDIDELPLA